MTGPAARRVRNFSTPTLCLLLFLDIKRANCIRGFLVLFFFFLLLLLIYLFFRSIKFEFERYQRNKLTI